MTYSDLTIKCGWINVRFRTAAFKNVQRNWYGQVQRMARTDLPIGLAICQRVAANHGGGITATSVPGQGSTFSLFLPLGAQ